jgi:iron(III) transport system permease protein
MVTVRLPGSRGAPTTLIVIATAIALALFLPFVFLVMQASHAGWNDVSRLLFRHLTVVLLGNTIQLAVLVSAICAVTGTLAAWVVERTDFPLRNVWAVLVVLPVAIPDFVVGYAWHSVAPAVRGLWGATLVMSLALYPLVYLPVAAALRRADPAQEEVARSLGYGPVATFVKVTIRQVWPAITGGCLVVCLALLAEYGAFEIVGFQTFTTTIFAEWTSGLGEDVASALALVLVLLGLIVLAGEAISSRTRAPAVAGIGQWPRRRHLAPGWRVVSTVGLAGLAALGLGVPIGVLAYWMASSHSSTLPGESVWSALQSTATYSSGAALIATFAALPVALLAVRYRSPGSVVLERSTFLVQALPGLVIALTLVFFSERYIPSAYQTGPLLVIAYSILFFPLALICVRASVAQAPRRLEEVARSLGKPPWRVLLRVTLPLVAPGLAAGFCLVFLSAVTELTATLILVPFGVQTLATQFWAFQTETSYGAAAPYALVIVALAAVPSYLLTRWFDRRPAGLPARPADEVVQVLR